MSLLPVSTVPVTTVPVSVRPVVLALLLPACAASAPAPAPQSAPESAATTSAAAAPAKPIPPAINPGAVLAVPLLDDLEDGNHQTVIAEGRGGYWYTYADETSKVEPSGTFSPTAGGAEGSAFAARMQGQIGTKQYPYAGIGFNLTDPMDPYDLSSCEGISFRAKKGSAEAVSVVRLKVGDVYTVPQGNVCKACYNDFGEDLTLTPEWTLHEVKFADMRQEAYWGEPRPKLDVSRVFQVQFLVKDPSAPFDVWLDDFRLLGCKGAKAP